MLCFINFAYILSIMKKILIILLTITLVLSIFLTSTKYVTLNHNFYKKEFSKHNVYDKIYNADEISDKLIGFFKDENKLPLIFNEKEASHLKDVKKLVKKGNILLKLLSLTNIILLSFLLYFKGSLKKLAIYSGILSILLPIPFILLNFSNLFTRFHLLLFPQGNWIFPSTSLMIQLFPYQFFYDAFIRIIIYSLILIFIVFFSSRFSSN